MLCALLCGPSPAFADEQLLAVGRVKELGPGARGHGRILRQALGAELSQSGAFTLVAGTEEKAEVNRTIKRNFRATVDERYWVELGKEKGATHLLLGEVQESRNVCSAFAELIHLESRRTVVSRPEPYDCTQSDLRAVAGDLAEQLSGRRASPKVERRHRLREAPPLQIVMEGRTAKVGGETYTFHEGQVQPTPPAGAHPTPPSPALPPSAPPSNPRPDLPEPVPLPNPPAFSEPSLNEARLWSSWTVEELADRLRPSVSITLVSLGLAPLLGVLLLGILGRLSPNTAGRLLRMGLHLSLIALSAELAAIAHLGGPNVVGVLESLGWIEATAPFGGVLLWSVGGALVGLSAQVWIGRALLQFLSWTLALWAALAVALPLAWPWTWAAGLGGAICLGLRIIAAWPKRRAAPAQTR